jgi:hypothetical protein
MTSGRYNIMFILTTIDTRPLTGKQAMSSKNPHLAMAIPLADQSSYHNQVEQVLIPSQGVA